MIPHTTPPLNLSRRDDSSPNSSAGPMIGAIFGIAIGIFILSLICIKLIGVMKQYQSNPQLGRLILLGPPTSNANPSGSRPAYGNSRGSGGSNTRRPGRPNVNGAYGFPVMPPLGPGPAPPPPTVTSDDSDNSGGFPFGPGIYPPGAWVDHANRSIPVDVRWNQRRDPRRSRSAHRP